MKTFETNGKITKAVRNVTAAALIAGFVFMPATGSAGLRDRVQQARNNVTELKNKVQVKAEDLQDKANNLDAEGMKQMKEMVESMLQFVKKIQGGYKDFAGANQCDASSPCGAFRGQLRAMILSFVNLPQDLPFVEDVPPVVKQLKEMARLVDFMPPPILYVTEKVLGNMFDEIQYRLDMVRFAAARIPRLPTMAELAQAMAYSPRANSTPATARDARSTNNSAAGQFPFCAATLDTAKPHIELLLTSIKALHETLSDIAGMMPNERTIGISAIGEGATVTIKDPPKGALDTVILLAKTMERKLTLKLAVIKSVCAIAGYTPSSN